MNNIPPINKGIPVLEVEGKNKTNFLSGIFLRWLKDVANRLNRAVVTDANGNIAYGGATIPDDPLESYFYLFYPNGAARIVTPTGYLMDSTNAYVNSAGQWARIKDGPCSLNIMANNYTSVAQFEKHVAASGLAGSLISWSHINLIDFSGNTNIKTGSTYTATL